MLLDNANCVYSYQYLNNKVHQYFVVTRNYTSKRKTEIFAFLYPRPLDDNK